MGKHSELEFLSDDLLNARVRLNQGSAVIQVMEYSGMEEAGPLSVVCGQTEVRLPGKGLYRFDCAPALESLRLTVHRGIATVRRGQKTYEVRKKRSVSLGKVDNLEGIDSKPPLDPFLVAASDPLGEWSRRRSLELAKSRRRFAKRMRSMD
jgi:ferric-dicitrate binding protein FerR (iron transport regulator)